MEYDAILTRRDRPHFFVLPRRNKFYGFEIVVLDKPCKVSVVLQTEVHISYIIEAVKALGIHLFLNS